MSVETLVLDASVGVKWFKNEPGTPDASAVLDGLRDGTVGIVVPAVFPHEVLDVARRIAGPDAARRVWEGMSAAGIVVAGLDARLVSATLALAVGLGITLYDAAAPALAERLGATLVSADRRAHASIAGVWLLA